MWWKNTKVVALSGVVGLVSVFILLRLGLADGGFWDAGHPLAHRCSVLWCRSQPMRGWLEELILSWYLMTITAYILLKKQYFLTFAALMPV